MSKLALGIIETIGLAAGIEAADTAVKSANVKLIGYELSKGGGMATIKIEGHVGAVKAAVDAACMAAEKVSGVWSKQVIPRPHEEIDKLIITKETVGLEINEEKKPLKEIYEQKIVEDPKDVEEEIEKAEEEQEEPKEQQDKAEEIKEPEVEIEIQEIEDNSKSEQEDSQPEDSEKKEDLEKEEVIDKDPEEICNLCGDPKCPRKKGDPRKDCINNEN